MTLSSKNVKIQMLKGFNILLAPGAFPRVC
nr:MAG TPA: hypothetical protein [Caudoviricetes sp.]